MADYSNMTEEQLKDLNFAAHQEIAKIRAEILLIQAAREQKREERYRREAEESPEGLSATIQGAIAEAQSIVNRPSD